MGRWTRKRRQSLCREDWPVIESSGEGDGRKHRPFKRCSSRTANNINRATSHSHNGPLWRRPVACERLRARARVNARNINRERRRALLSSRDAYYHVLHRPSFLSYFLFHRFRNSRRFFFAKKSGNATLK